MERKTDETVLSLSSKRTIREIILAEINRGPRFCIISRRENRGGNPERYNTRFLRGTLAKVRRSSRIFFTGFLFCFTVVAACQLDNGSIFLEARRGGEGERRRECLGNCPDPDEFRSPFLFLHFSKRDDIETSRKLPRLILVRKIQELADSGEIKSCHGIK